MHISNHEENYTRFLLIGNIDFDQKQVKNKVSSVLISDDKPGSLLQSLNIFSDLDISKNYIDEFLARRQKSLGSGGRMNIEKDEIFITSGVINNLSTGGPIAIKIINKDWKNWKDKIVVMKESHTEEDIEKVKEKAIQQGHEPLVIFGVERSVVAVSGWKSK